MILIASAISLFIYFCVFISFPVQYESNAIIYNASPDKKEDNLQLQDGREGFKIINFVYSSDLINHLIKKFDLAKHYDIKAKGSDADAECFNTIAENIAVSSTFFGAVKISVRDYDRFMAADLTNEIVARVNTLNEELVLRQRKKLANDFEALSNAFFKDVTAERDSLNHLINVFNSGLNKGNLNSEKIMNARQTLMSTALNYEHLSREWLTMRRSHLVSLNNAQKNNLAAGTIVKYALPQKALEFYSPVVVGKALLSAFSGFWLATLLLLVYHKYRSYTWWLLTSINDDETATDTKVYPISQVEEDESSGLNSNKETDTTQAAPGSK